MLEKPDIPDELILSGIRDQYGLHPGELTFLPLGYDVNTAVYRFATADKRSYFLKLRGGYFDPVCVRVPQMLKAGGVQAIIVPLLTNQKQLYGSLGEFKLILYPFIEGQDGYQKALSAGQWLDFGIALKEVHSIQAPQKLKSLIPQEAYSAYWREKVKEFQAQVEKTGYQEPAAQKLALFIREKQDEIRKVVERAEALSRELQLQSPERVLCHADIHPGNLLISPDGPIYIVDWDSPILAPKEKDLALIGGCAAWSSPQAEALFYQGYGATEVDPTALAYFRYERIVQDLAEFGKQLLMTDAGGEDREQSFQYFASCFLPGHEIELADRIFIAGGQ